MTVNDIITWVRNAYPRATSTIFPDSICILNLNMIHKEEYIKLRRLKNRYFVDTNTTTIADQLEYTLPNNCSIENIEHVEIEGQEYHMADAEEYINYGYFYRYGSADNKIEIWKNGNPIDVDNKQIIIKYFPKPSELTLTSQTPDLDSDYHNLLCYRLIQRLASLGETPDVDVANYWQSEYETMFAYIKKDFEAKKAKTTTTITTIRNVYGGF
jgi:ribosomal protein S8